MILGKAECGLKYAIKKSCSSVGFCALYIKCGTRDEGHFHSGIAHFTEHTLFKGTEHKTSRAINNYLDRLGGELNAFTTKEEIVLHSTVLKQDLNKAVSLLLELATCPTFPEKEIEVEKGVVIDEIISYKDSPEDDIYDRFEEALFKGHPLGKLILGTEANVRKISSSELHKFINQWFIPENMALTIVTDSDESKVEASVLKLVEKVFAGTSRKGNTRIIQDPVLHEPFFKKSDKQNHEANVVIGNVAPSLYDTKKRFSTILLSNIIGGPASNSMLNDLMRERKGWVYNVESTYSQFTEIGILAISLGCDEANLDKCLKAVRQTCTKMIDTPLSEARIKAAKRQLLGQLAISSSNGETQCLSMGKSLISFGTIQTDAYNSAAIEAISPLELQTIAAEILDPEKMSTLIYI